MKLNKEATRAVCFVACGTVGLMRSCTLPIRTVLAKTVSFFQDRGRRQLSGRFEGDIILNSAGSNPLMSDAAIADPDKLWPGGNVEYEFYKSITRSQIDYLCSL